MGLKRTILGGLHRVNAFGLTRRVRRSQFRGVTALLYHRVLPATASREHDAAIMGEPTAPQLEQLIRHLKQSFHFATPQECLDRWAAGREVEPRTLLLTFDDGYADLYENLLPVLTRCDVPATVFLTTGAIGNERPLWFQKLFAAIGTTTRTTLPVFDSVPGLPLRTAHDRVAAIEAVSGVQRRHPATAWEALIDRLVDDLAWNGSLEGQKMMTWPQVEALYDSGRVTLGGHTVTHPCLDCCDDAQVDRELFANAADLRERFSRTDFVPFSYPHGRAPSPAVQDRVRRAGFACGFTGRRSANTRHTPLFELGREHVPADDLPRAAFLLSGLKSRATRPVPLMETAR